MFDKTTKSSPECVVGNSVKERHKMFKSTEEIGIQCDYEDIYWVS